MLVQHISELEEWDAILLQELSFKDELLSLEELEASLGRHKLVANVKCPRSTAIIIHCRWMGSIRWIASSQHALWVGVRAAHLPSWVSDDCFEQSVEEVLEAGRCKASGSIFSGSMPTAILMTVMISRMCWSRNCALCIICSCCSNAFGRWLGSPQREACGRRRWISSSRTSLLQKLRLQKNCIRGVITSRSAFRGHMCQVLCSSSKGKRSHWRDGHHKRRHNIMSYTAHSPSTCLWGPRSGKFNKLLRR